MGSGAIMRPLIRRVADATGVSWRVDAARGAKRATTSAGTTRCPQPNELLIFTWFSEWPTAVQTASARGR
jgi:hypothetical protein